MLTYVCPVCKSEASLDLVIRDAIDDAEARRLIEYLIKTYQPTLGADVLRYLRLHTPKKQRLTWARARRILSQIVEAMRSRKINRAGRDWPVTVDDWSAAFRAIFDANDKGTLSLPLKDNAYLYAVLVRLVDKSEAIAEAKAEQEKRVGPRPAHTGTATTVGDAINNAMAGAIDSSIAKRHEHEEDAPPPGLPILRPTTTQTASKGTSPLVRLMREQVEKGKARRQRLLAAHQAQEQEQMDGEAGNANDEGKQGDDKASKTD